MDLLTLILFSSWLFGVMVFKDIAFICNIWIIICDLFNAVNNYQKSVIYI